VSDSKQRPTSLPIFDAIECQRGVVSQIKVEGSNIIYPWGVEFADASSFFSLEPGHGYRYRIVDMAEKASGSRQTTSLTIQMKQGLVRLDLQQWQESETCYRRSARLLCLGATRLMDFVLRQRFVASCLPQGYIDERTLAYRGVDLNFQRRVAAAGVGNPLYSVWVRLVDSHTPASMQRYFYLRDSAGSWVLHCRMLPKGPGEMVIKLCSRYFQTRPLPAFLNRRLLDHLSLREMLWYRGERNPYRRGLIKYFAPNAYPLVDLPKGEELRWDVRCTIEPPHWSSAGETPDLDRAAEAEFPAHVSVTPSSY